MILYFKQEYCTADCDYAWLLTVSASDSALKHISITDLSTRSVSFLFLRKLPPNRVVVTITGDTKSFVPGHWYVIIVGALSLIAVPSCPQYERKVIISCLYWNQCSLQMQSCLFSDLTWEVLRNGARWLLVNARPIWLSLKGSVASNCQSSDSSPVMSSQYGMPLNLPSLKPATKHPMTFPSATVVQAHWPQLWGYHQCPCSMCCGLYPAAFQLSIPESSSCVRFNCS